MNIQEDLKTYFEANPVSNFKNLAKLKSWELVNDGFYSASFGLLLLRVNFFMY